MLMLCFWLIALRDKFVLTVAVDTVCHGLSLLGAWFLIV